MKIAIGCQGRFHLLDLARQMEQRGYLDHFYTGYPRFKIDDLPRAKVSTFPWLMTPYMAAGRFGFGSSLEILERLIVRCFDDWTARNIEECNVYHCLSASGVRTHALVRDRYGAVTISDRPCSHIVFQEQILREEYELQGQRFKGIDPYLKQRELDEYESCDLIVVPSTFALRSFVELGVPAKKLRQNTLGADLRLFKPLPKHDDIFRVIYAGALSFQKGIPYLLRALSGLNSLNLEIWLIGQVQPEMKGLLAKHEGQYRYVGVVDRNSLPWFYSQGSVLILPSVQDGFGMVQAEAMACGLPVIATTNTGAEDLFTDGLEGFVVPIRDPEAIREKVLALYQNRDLQDEMSKAALRRVTAIGGWRDYGDRSATLYRDALAARSKSKHAISAA